MPNVHGSKWIRPEKRLAIYLRDEFTCAYCGRNLHNAKAADVTLDHLTPRVRGGSNEATNLVTACCSCNSQRQHKSWRKFAPAGSHKRIERSVRRKLDMDLAKAIIAGKSAKCER